MQICIYTDISANNLFDILRTRPSKLFGRRALQSQETTKEPRKVKQKVRHAASYQSKTP